MVTMTGAGEGVDVVFSVEEISLDELLLSEVGGSGRCSRFDWLQRGQTQSRDLKGYSE